MTIMKTSWFRPALGFSLALTLIACSGLSVIADFDPSANFSAYQTYEWLPDTTSKDSGISGNPLIDRRIRMAIENNLNAKGYHKVEDGGDLAVGYQLSTHEEVSYSTMYSGWGGYGYHWDYWDSGVGVGSSTTQRNVTTVGQLVIGVFDEQTRDLVWYGTGEKTINQRQQSPEKSQEKLNDIVSRIMESLPPGT